MGFWRRPADGWWIERRKPRTAYAIGIGVGAVTAVLAIVALSFSTPLGSDLSSLRVGGNGPAFVDSVSIDIAYTSGHGEWLGSPSQNGCRLATNCPFVFNGTFVLYLSALAPLREYNVTGLSAPFTLQFGQIQYSSVEIGYTPCILGADGPSSGSYHLTVYVDA